jgi:phosphocarrier protein HPr
LPVLIQQEVEIINKLGLHARAAAKFVTTASEFQSDIHLSRNGQQVNGKSIMGVMMLAAAKGSKLELTIEGSDEQQACDALVELINNRFDEEQ